VTRRERIALAICIAVHAAVVWNVYEFDKMTPRIIEVTFTAPLDTACREPQTSI
jgi:hypothetical protein